MRPRPGGGNLALVLREDRCMPRKNKGVSAIAPDEGKRVFLRGSGTPNRSPSAGIIDSSTDADAALRVLARILVNEALAKHKKKYGNGK